MIEMEELDKIAPKLSHLKKENPFKVPDNYFEDFASRLDVKLNEDTGEQKKQNSIIRYLKPAMGLAASFILIFMLVYWPINSFLPKLTDNSELEKEFENSEINDEDIYISIVEKVGDNSLLAILDGEYEEELLSEEDLVNYISSNFSDVDIYLESE